jgi:hypothetical protein
MQNAPIKLNRAFLALAMTKNDFLKVSSYVPRPSHTLHHTGLQTQNVTIVYELDRSVTSKNQFRWLSEIKRAWTHHIIVPFEFVNEVYINTDTESTGAIYSLLEISKRFKTECIKYPKIYYPSKKKELYRRLIWYAGKLYNKGILELDLLISVALKMNKTLELKDQYGYRELLKKASAAFRYIKENAKPKLTKEEVQIRLIEGGKTRGVQRKEEHAQNVRKVKEALSLHVKPNGKVNITQLSKAVTLSRPTVSDIVKTLLSLCFFSFILVKCIQGRAIIPIAYFTLLQEAHIYGVLGRSNHTKNIQSCYFSYTDSLLYTFGKEDIKAKGILVSNFAKNTIFATQTIIS